ncbi:MAG: hypothetical protein JL56_11840 [Desulfotomaculum sp. BICA1-6]|nr:MAG: hypothetical protein VR67_03440 [Peptococcaceae bacterium BRH_c8a]KJS73078.1 MAG: hypothetical protein JL56_11840 [Desulfotomaculum sp. BICA1-6]
MPKIKILDESTACRIAAGEVVERPVSVVKELVENSLDAGADRITVTLVGGGADAITVVDNGCGISQEDTPLAFHRHATSKINDAADLGHIETLGFRGEALPSIAAVADLQIKTRTPQDNAGYLMRVHGGTITEFGPTGCPVGTSIAITDLFFNTPARRKHMKTKSTEGGLIADLIYKLSLIRPGVRFAMEQRGREVFRSPGTGKLLDAIAAVYGVEEAGMMVPVTAVEGDITVVGYVGKPELNRSTRQQITVSVNGRLVRSSTVNQALEEAYKGLISIGRYPLAVLQLQLPPALIDVNVHPAKTEIKIENEEQLAQLISTTVRRSLRQTNLIPAVGSNLINKPSLPATAEPFKLSFDTADNKKTTVPHNVAYDSLLPQAQPECVMEILKYIEHEKDELPEPNDAEPAGDPVNMESQATVGAAVKAVVGHLNETVTTEAQPDYRGAEFPRLQVVAQLLNMYIIAESEGSVYLIDQHAAHERVLFEKYYEQLQNNTPQVQYLLVPLSVNLRAHEKELLWEYRSEIEALGFVLDDFGRDSLLLRGIPGDSSPGKSERLIEDMLETIVEQGKPGGLGVKFALSALLACKAAIKAGEKLAIQAMQSLVEQLAAANEPFTCPHGRPTLVSISRRELSVMFKRA